MRLALTLSACLLLPLSGTARAQDAGTVTIYRCTDASGKTALRDSPCPKGQTQAAREMLRPTDAPRKPAAPPAPTAAAQPAPEPRTVYLAPPQPMYECTTPDGERYTSDTADGNPRWVPFWTQGYRRYGSRGQYAPPGSFRPATPSVPSISIPRSSPRPEPMPAGHGGHRRLPWQIASGGGQWIRDTCTMLPPAEACDIMRDRRDAIRTRFFNAQEKERDVLRVEERRINARLANDC